jgi:two-component system, response regulator PdtaR
VDVADQSGAQTPPFVLVVEDDPDLRSLAAAVVEEVGLSVVEMASAEAALAFLREHAPDVVCVFADFELAGPLDGLDIARVAAVSWPWVKVLITSGSCRITDVPKTAQFLPKPWRAADVWAHLESAVPRERAMRRASDGEAPHLRR